MQNSMDTASDVTTGYKIVPANMTVVVYKDNGLTPNRVSGTGTASSSSASLAASVRAWL